MHGPEPARLQQPPAQGVVGHRSGRQRLRQSGKLRLCAVGREIVHPVGHLLELGRFELTQVHAEPELVAGTTCRVVGAVEEDLVVHAERPHEPYRPVEGDGRERSEVARTRRTTRPGGLAADGRPHRLQAGTTRCRDQGRRHPLQVDQDCVPQRRVERSQLRSRLRAADRDQLRRDGQVVGLLDEPEPVLDAEGRGEPGVLVALGTRPVERLGQTGGCGHPPRRVDRHPGAVAPVGLRRVREPARDPEASPEVVQPPGVSQLEVAGSLDLASRPDRALRAQRPGVEQSGEPALQHHRLDQARGIDLAQRGADRRRRQLQPLVTEHPVHGHVE